MAPKISVITCTWNSAETLQQTIDSVACQHNCEIEHIFVDGGSTDNTLEIIERYGKAKTIIHGVRGGISRAMNEGAKHATGDVIAHLHSDDFYADAQTIETISDIFEREKCDWLVGRTANLRGGVIVEPRQQVEFSPFRYRTRQFFIAHPATFVRRDLFERVGGFNEALRYAMDIDLWLRLIPIAEPKTLTKTLTIFREHAGSLSTAQRRSARWEELKVWMTNENVNLLEKIIYLLRMSRSFM